MALAKFMFKIYDKETKQYIAVGYNQKATWLKFPGAVLKGSGLTDRDVEVHKFEIVHQIVGKLNVKGKEI